MDREVELEPDDRRPTRPPAPARDRRDRPRTSSRSSMGHLIAAARTSTVPDTQNPRVQRAAVVTASASHAISPTIAPRIQRATTKDFLRELDDGMTDDEDDETLDDDEYDYDAHMHDGGRPTLGDFIAPAMEAHAAEERRRQERRDALGMRPYDGSTPVMDAVKESLANKRVTLGTPVPKPAAEPIDTPAAAATDTSPAAAAATPATAATSTASTSASPPVAPRSHDEQIDDAVAKLYREKNPTGSNAKKVDLYMPEAKKVAQALATKLGAPCDPKEFQSRYKALQKADAPKVVPLPTRVVTRSKLDQVLPSKDSGGQKYSKTFYVDDLEYHVSVEFSDYTKATTHGPSVTIKKMHVSFEKPDPKVTKEADKKKDRYWYHWDDDTKKFTYDSRAGRNLSDMRQTADRAMRTYLPKLNCPDL